MLSDAPRNEVHFSTLYPDLDITAAIKIVNFESAPTQIQSTSKETNIQAPKAAQFSLCRLYDQLLGSHFSPPTETMPRGYDVMIRNTPVQYDLYPATLTPKSYREKSHRINNFSECIYDLDIQDMMFIGFLSAQYDFELPARLFEECMSFLELEILKVDLYVPLPKNMAPNGVDETEVCAVCDSSDSESGNSIIFCDRCNVAVHQECYGVPLIPEGQWLCRSCSSGVDPSGKECLFCPWRSGALIPVDSFGWSHVLCCFFIPEVHLSNGETFDNACGFKSIPKSRWGLCCSVCKIKKGACIQCVKPTCFTSFHVTCAAAAGLLRSEGSENYSLAVLLDTPPLCSKHMPKARIGGVDLSAARRSLEIELQDLESSSTDEVSYPYWRTANGIYLLPDRIVQKLCQFIKQRHKLDITKICGPLARYWVLKHQLKGTMYSRKLRPVAEHLKLVFTRRAELLPHLITQQSEIHQLLKSAREVREALKK